MLTHLEVQLNRFLYVPFFPRWLVVHRTPSSLVTLCQHPSRLLYPTEALDPLGRVGRRRRRRVLPPSSGCKPVRTTPSPVFRATLVEGGECAELGVSL
jgi:hypothetical protein